MCLGEHSTDFMPFWVGSPSKVTVRRRCSMADCFRDFFRTTRHLAPAAVEDRFLTGIYLQQYFFHCMAGREVTVKNVLQYAVISKKI